MMLLQVQVNRVCKVQAKATIEAVVRSQAKVKDKTLGERLAEVKAKVTHAEMLVAVDVHNS